MSNTTKAFNQLTPAEKQARIASYKAQDAKYGLKEGLFRLTHVSRHADKKFANGTTASFGYNVVPVKGYDANDFKKNEFVWVNQLINVDTGSKVIDAMDQLATEVNGKTEDGKNKSILVSIKYKKSAKGYINVNSLFRRDAKKSATAKAPVAPAQPQTDEDANLPY